MNTAQKRKTIKVDDNSNLFRTVTRFNHDETDNAQLARMLGANSPTNLHCLNALVFEIDDIIQNGHTLLETDTGITIETFNDVAWLAGALLFIETKKEVQLNSLDILQQGPKVIRSLYTYYEKVIDAAAKDRVQTHRKLEQQLSKERSNEGLADQMMKELNESCRTENNTVSLEEIKYYNKCKRHIDDIRAGKLSRTMVNLTWATRELSARIETDNYTITRNRHVLEGLNRMSERLEEIANAATPYTLIKGCGIKIANDNIQLK